MQIREPFLIAGIVLVAALSACGRSQAPGALPQPGFNLFSKQQDVQIGQESAAKVTQEYQVAQDPRLQDYVRRVGAILASTPTARQSGFPFQFTMLDEKQVNAFALPGGAIFVFSGTLPFCDNEAEFAGVLAHEMSHVILRHGTNQLSKAEIIQLPAELAGAALPATAMGQIVATGVGVGLNGLFLHYSREDESQADDLGAHIMAEAGYNPVAMAQFFEKLKTLPGPGVPQFLSDHPSPGNRVQAVEAIIRTMPPRPYALDLTGQFPAARQMAAALPPPPPGKK
jgi:predicted Zn-dependent protease